MVIIFQPEVLNQHLSSPDICAFLGLVCYIADFLPKLTEYTCILTPLMMKDAKTHFAWDDNHQSTLDNIKTLVAGADCPTVIDHDDPENKIFVACNSSDWWTGACLSFGKTKETLWPVAYDSIQLSKAEKHYPIHTKELLAIVHALKKWWTDLLETNLTVYMDYWTLEIFNTQKDLSHCQLHCQEYMSQYEVKIVYIQGEDNYVADTHSQVPDHSLPDEHPDTLALYKHWKKSVRAVLSVSSNTSVLSSINAGYSIDAFCQKLSKNNIPGANLINGLWYTGERFAKTCSDLNMILWDILVPTSHMHAYYCPNMWTDLKKAYVPSCTDCQHNKSCTTKALGPLHPLLIPDEHGDSVTLDFIGPLPNDHSYNCILTMTDCIGSDIHLIPTWMVATAEDVVLMAFDNWYCKNRLPLDFISNRDKLFMSHFWKALMKLANISLKMSSAYHPQTDGSSKQRSIPQCLQPIQRWVQ